MKKNHGLLGPRDLKTLADRISFWLGLTDSNQAKEVGVHLQKTLAQIVAVTDASYLEPLATAAKNKDKQKLGRIKRALLLALNTHLIYRMLLNAYPGEALEPALDRALIRKTLQLYNAEDGDFLLSTLRDALGLGDEEAERQLEVLVETCAAVRLKLDLPEVELTIRSALLPAGLQSPGRRRKLLAVVADILPPRLATGLPSPVSLGYVTGALLLDPELTESLSEEVDWNDPPQMAHSLIHWVEDIYSRELFPTDGFAPADASAPWFFQSRFLAQLAKAISPPVSVRIFTKLGRLAATAGSSEDSDATINELLTIALQGDLDGLTALLDQTGHSSKEGDIMDKMDVFYWDPSGLPNGLSSHTMRDAYVDEVRKHIAKATGQEVATIPDIDTAAAVGMLLLDERFDPAAGDFYESVRDLYFNEYLAEYTDHDGNSALARDIFSSVFATLIADRHGGPGTSSGTPHSGNGPAQDLIAFREFGAVGRYVVDRNDEVPLGHPNFAVVVELGVSQYVGGISSIASLELPELVTSSEAGTEIESDNVRAVGTIYAAQQLEEMRLFDVVDRILELFMNGLLPLGASGAGKRLDDFYWKSEDRLNKSARAMVFARVLGGAGDVSHEVHPNGEFNNLWLRFLAAISEFSRQQRFDNLFETAKERRLGVTGERVRKAGHDLAANISLYGYASTHFAAQRLNAHVDTAFKILDEAEVQRVWGVSGPYQVIEKVTSAEFRSPVNIIRRRTMALAGKTIMDLMAKHRKVWRQSLGGDLFGLTSNDPSADIPMADQKILVRQAELWLTVNGITDQDVNRYSEPSESVLAPSIPAFGNTGTLPAAGNDSGGAMDQIRQMVSSGQTPSLEQLRGLLNT